MSLLTDSLSAVFSTARFSTALSAASRLNRSFETVPDPTPSDDKITGLLHRLHTALHVHCAPKKSKRDNIQIGVTHLRILILQSILSDAKCPAMFSKQVVRTR